MCADRQRRPARSSISTGMVLLGKQDLRRSFLPGRTNVRGPAEKAGGFIDSHRNGPARQAGPTVGPSCREGRMCADRQRRPARSSIRAGMVLLGKQDLQ